MDRKNVMDLAPTQCGHYGTRNNRGEPCRAPIVRGTQRCHRHAGKALVKAKAEGQVRIELAHWGTDDSYVDPGEQFLRLIAQSARRCELYSSLLEADYQDRKVSALVGTSYGEGGPSGEYLRGLAELEARERRFCADLCAKAIAAGLEARKVQLAERMGASVVQAISGALGRLGVDVGDARVRGAVAAEMLELGG